MDFTDTFTDPDTGTQTTADLGEEDSSSGEATFYVSMLAVGEHSIIATYLPDAASGLVFAGSLSSGRPAGQGRDHDLGRPHRAARYAGAGSKSPPR